MPYTLPLYRVWPNIEGRRLMDCFATYQGQRNTGVRTVDLGPSAPPRIPETLALWTDKS